MSSSSRKKPVLQKNSAKRRWTGSRPGNASFMEVYRETKKVPFPGEKENYSMVVMLFLVPIKGGRDFITSQKAIYKWYISGIYC